MSSLPLPSAAAFDDDNDEWELPGRGMEAGAPGTLERGGTFGSCLRKEAGGVEGRGGRGFSVCLAVVLVLRASAD